MFCRKSQQELSEQLDSLIAQLRSIEDIQEASLQFDGYVQKLINIKHKVTVIYSVLQGAQVKFQWKTPFIISGCPIIANVAILWQRLPIYSKICLL